MVIQTALKIGRSFTKPAGRPEFKNGKAVEVEFSGLSNLSINDDKVATAKITASGGQTPRAVPILAKDFGFNFPDRNTAIRGISAQWEDWIRNTSGGTNGVPNISGTSLKLLIGGVETGNNLVSSGVQPTNSASGVLGGSVASGTGINGLPINQGTTVASTEKTHYLSKPISNVTGTVSGTGIEKVGTTVYSRWGIAKITADQVMNANFGVRLDYASNSGTNPGIINVDYIALAVYYETPEYSMTVSQTGTVLKNGDFNVSITLKNTNNANNGVAIPVTVALPAGAEYVSHNTGKDNVGGSFDKYSNTWQAKLTGANGSAVLNLTLKATTTGTKQVKATEYYTKKAATGTINVIVDTYTIKTNFPTDLNLTRGQDFSYTVTVETNQDLVKTKVIDLPLNNGVLLTKYSSPNCTYDIKTGKWNVTLVNRKATITFYLTVISQGDFEQTITLGDQVFIQNFTISSEPVTHVSYSIIEPPESFFQFLEDGETYTLSTYCEVQDTYLTQIFNGLKNNRLGVLIGQNEVLGTRCSNVNTIEEIYVEFIYNENLPINIIIYGQYLELDLTNSMLFGAWQLKKGSYIDEDYQNPVILFDSLQSLIENVDYTSTNIGSRLSTAKYFFKDIDFSAIESDETIIKRGIGILFDYEIENEITVESQLHSDRSSTKRSIILDPDENVCLLGDITEKWGLQSHEINLNKLSFDLKFINNWIMNQEISIKNVRVVLFYELDITGGSQGFRLNGEHSREYGVFVFDVEDEAGANNKLEKLSLKGSDGELGTGSRIEAKNIPIKFSVTGNTIEEAEILFQKVIQWLTQDRDKTLIPTKQELILDWASNISFLAIAEGSFKKKYNVSTIESEVNFVVLDGIGYTRKQKVTGPTGINNGLTTVYPTLQVICLGGAVKIVESVDQQEMVLTGNWENGRVLTIDCYKRTIFDDLGNNHTKKASLSWGWFGLLEDYDFSMESENCIVEKVIYKEGIG